MAKVLVACEYSGIVRDAFAAQGHDAWSCDILPTECPGQHYQGDVLDIIEHGWDLMIAHPPCQYLCRAGARWWKGREQEQLDALDFVRRLLAAPIPRIALENPPGRIGTAIRKASQTVHPWQFGHSENKITQLWLVNLPLLTPTEIVAKGDVIVYASGRRLPKTYANTPIKNRSAIRAKTYEGIARAMATQWGNLL